MISAPIVLASGSPRRKDLLSEAGYQFEVRPPDIEEIDDPSIGIRELTAINAKIKALAVAENTPDQVVIAADTLVLFNERSLGKPADLTEAATMLAELNGKTHHVYTAVCLIKHGSGQIIEFDVATEVTFRELSEEEMKNYHSLIDPLDKAGAYAAQEHGHLIIAESNGSATNVIGLPMEEVAEKLKNHFAIEPLI